VRLLPRPGGGLVLTDQVRGDRESFEIVGRQIHVATCRRQPCKSLAPQGPVEGHTTLIENLRRSHTPPIARLVPQPDGRRCLAQQSTGG
jgi:hypothetical protein